MKPSSFQFSNPILVNMTFEVNRHFKGDNNVDIPTNFNVSIHEDENSPEAIVELTVEIGRRDESTPYYISPALLLGYLRSVIATVSSASPFETINIPFMDFTKKEEHNE